MIKNILLPTQIHNLFLFKEQVLVLYVYKSFVRGIVFSCFGRSKKIIWSRIVLASDQDTSSIVVAIKKLLYSAPRYHKVVFDSGEQHIFLKELIVPFIDHEKIRMVLPFELEQVLPFSVAQATFDFHILQKNETKKESKILVCATQRESLQKNIEQIQQAGVKVDQVSVLPLALHFAGYIPVEHFAVYVGLSSTWILYSNKQGVLRFVRHIDFSVLDILYDMSEQEGTEFSELWLQYERKELGSVFMQNASFLAQQVNLSLLAAEQELGAGFKQGKPIIFAGSVTHYADFVTAVQKHLHTDMQHPQVVHFLTKTCGIQGVDAQKLFLYEDLIYVAYYMQYASHPVSLWLDELYKQAAGFLKKQVIVAAIFTVLLCGGFVGYSWYRQQEWQDHIMQSQQRMFKDIQRVIPTFKEKFSSSTKLVKDVERTVQKEERLWFSFSQQSERSLLEYWQKLAQAIDRESLGLKLHHLYIDHDEVRLQGHVKDFDALRTFEQELLQIPILHLAQKPRELDFDVTLTTTETKEKS